MSEGKYKTSSDSLKQFGKELFKDDSDSSDIPEIECELCSKEFSNVKAYKQHLNSQKHYKMVQKEKLKNKSKAMEEDQLKAPAEGAESGSGGDEDDSDEITCEICKKTVFGYVPYLAHLKGSAHKKNVKKQILKTKLMHVPGVLPENNAEEGDDDDLPKAFARCGTCKKTFYDPQAFNKHMKGPNHKKKAREQNVSETLLADLDEDDDIRCEDCNKVFSSSVNLKMHLEGTQHEKRMRRIQKEKEVEGQFDRDEDGNNFVCKECKKVFSDPAALKLHLSGDSHEKQKVKDAVFAFVEKHPEITVVKTLSGDEENATDEEYKVGQYFMVCKLCHTSLQGPENARDHVKSKNHQKRLEEKKQMKILAESMKKKTTMSNGHGHKEKKKHDGEDDFEVI